MVDTAKDKKEYTAYWKSRICELYIMVNPLLREHGKEKAVLDFTEGIDNLFALLPVIADLHFLKTNNKEREIS